MMNQIYKIAELIIHMISNHNILMTQQFAAFQINKIKEDGWNLIVQSSALLSTENGRLVYQCLDYEVYDLGHKMIYIYVDRDSLKEYAISQIDYDSKTVYIQYLKDFERFFSETNNCFYHSQWERVFIEEGRMILHSSCVDTPYGGILFSGPSGIGKSTQSDLWIKYEGAKLINGDRPIIRKTADGWYAYGSPYAGSSRCHINEKTPVRAIVMLRQAKENSLRKLSLREAMIAVYQNLTIYTWDQVFVEKVLDLTTSIIQDIPVYELSCLPEQSAVEVLKKEFEEH